MNIDNLLEYSNKIKNQAAQIIDENKIFKILTFNGNPLMIGSYALDLMYDRDIDIVVESRNLKKDSINSLIKFIESEKFSKIEYGDFIKFPRKNRPNGYIINLHILHEEENCEIEIWFLNNIYNYEIELTDFKKKNNGNIKNEILLKKLERNNLGIDKHKKSSYEIYKEVLK